MAKLYDVIIIGSGPAGYTAAIYAARSNLSVLMFQGYQTGGQLMLTSDVENYPGFEEGILGPPMMEKEQGRASKVAPHPALVGPELLDDLLIPIPAIDCHTVLLAPQVCTSRPR